MQQITQLGIGIWHITEFVQPDYWEHLKQNILNLPDSNYKDRQEPMRNRCEVTHFGPEIYTELIKLAHQTVPVVSELTQHRLEELIAPPVVYLWRDFTGFMSWWHPDDFTLKPTIQIYIDGEEDHGTSFRIDKKEITIPFKPNTGYLMDNRYQIEHGMLTTIRQHVRQSLYMIY